MITGKRFVDDLANIPFDVTTPVSLAQIEAWRTRGVRVMGFRRQAGPVQPPSELSAPFEPGDAAILAGPDAVIRSLLETPVVGLGGHSVAGDEAVMANETSRSPSGVIDGHGRSD